jgi:uncharacterized protein YukE
MASRQTIEFDFKKALGQADKIDAIAERLNRLSGTEFGNTMQNLSAGWKGENASLYLTKGSHLQERMNSTAKELYTVSSEIRRIAKQVYDAEMAALAIALDRT